MKRGDTALKKTLTTALDELKRNGTYAELLTKYNLGQAEGGVDAARWAASTGTTRSVCSATPTWRRAAHAASSNSPSPPG
ncbi:hypothetical protein ACRAWF_20930 [Streptomyces sp. L7]